MNARLTSAAQADVTASLGWYRRTAQGLDRRFLQALDAAIQSICDHPEIGTAVEGDIRRHLLHGFPYVVFYLVRSGEVIVIACPHGARNPDGWQGRGAA